MDDNDYMLTTYDNPFNPYTQFDSWYKYDMRLGHDCCGLLGREAATSKLFSDEVNEQIIDEAMDRIINSFPLIYKKVSKKDYTKTA